MTEITRPASPSVSDKSSGTFNPWDLNPDLALLKMQEKYADKWPVPTIVSRELAVYDGIAKSLNHVDKINETFYDCSPRISIYANVGYQSVNIEGKLFNALFTMWNKPKVVMQGVNPNTFQSDEEQPSALTRFRNWISGRSANQENKA